MSHTGLGGPKAPRSGALGGGRAEAIAAEAIPAAVLTGAFALLPFAERKDSIPLVCKRWNRLTKMQPEIWKSCGWDGQELAEGGDAEVDWLRAVDWFLDRSVAVESLMASKVDFSSGTDAPAHSVLFALLGASLHELKLMDCRMDNNFCLSRAGLLGLHSLRHLEIRLSHGRIRWNSVSRLSRLANLEVLCIGCAGSVHDSGSSVSINFPQRLRRLEISGLGKVQAVFPPEVFQSWQRLEKLDLWGTGVRPFPESASTMSKLSELRVWIEPRKGEDPWVGLLGLHGLKHLELQLHDGLPVWRELRQLSQLRSLEMLHVDFEIQNAVWEDDCSAPAVISFPHRLRSLRLRCFGKINAALSPQAFQNWQRLETLDLWGTEVQSLPVSVSSLTNLVDLHIWTKFRLGDNTWAGLLNLRSLRRLELHLDDGLPAWTSISQLSKLPMLQMLHVEFIGQGIGYEHGRFMPIFIRFPQKLNSLRIRGFGKINAVLPMEALLTWKDMEALDLGGTEVQSLPASVAFLTKLTELRVWTKTNLAESTWTGLRCLTGLRHLELRLGDGFPSWNSMSQLSRLKCLESLHVDFMGRKFAMNAANPLLFAPLEGAK
ncbi:unnamed protein product [Ostreobium quekettii]|uniref:Disease resistance R13L4/SHOC-2-like LRR domain-containing protein n=1 Tax=Ostreobium quekettii TaxID=121088 RepID=A0A8S1J5R3_9CHLO|nr:unnamed protein product [Ostreobium quekettii]|eukprot:evm.model.scf_748.2 EVM.evm.TU.scf_748.2   scf_748:11576-14455(-)